jgi:hypothetical protein
MKKMSKIFVLAIVLMVLCCIGAASAADNSTADEVALSDEVVDVESVDELESIASSDEVVDDEVLVDEGIVEVTSSDEEYVIYVGQNKTDDGGNGSYENPFANLTLASNNVNGQNKVTVNIFNGTYYLGSILPFNTNNLHINGLNGEVIIKNVYNRYDGLYGEAFSLNSTANFTMSNIIFDATDHTQGSMDRGNRQSFFCPLYGPVNLAVFNNCSFIKYDFRNYILNSECNTIFSKCYIQMANLKLQPFNQEIAQNSIHIFDYCHIDITFNTVGASLSKMIRLPCNISINNCWFGENSLPEYITPPNGYAVNPDGAYNNTYAISVNRYAIFSVYENYLGNNQYEILGKLTWNGTEDQDGMENFQPMTVTLTSATGEVNNATLVNGNFRAVYTSSNSNNKITVTLDQEEKELNFNTTDIILEPVSIKYGEDQNITVTFPQAINSTVTISINNKTYDVKVNESNSFTYTFNDMVLKADTYIVNVTLNDEKAGLYGANSTTFTVSKVSDYAFSPDIPSEAKVGDNKTVTVELPSDATGNVTVYVNGNPFTQEASAVNEITISGFIAGDNTITVFYSGDDKYANKTTEPTIVTAEKVSDYSFDVIVPTDIKVGDDATITISLPNDVNGTASVHVSGQEPMNITVNSNSTDVTLSDLVLGNNTVTVTFSDDKYAEKTVTKNITVEKVPIEIKNDTIVVTPSETATPTVSINLPNATGELTVTVNGKNYTKKLVNGVATVDITDLPAGTYNATVSYSGDDKYASFNTTTTITVKETKQENNTSQQTTQTQKQTTQTEKLKTKIIAKNKKFKAKTKVKKYTITLKAGKKPVKKVQVTIKIGKKTYKAKTNNKGKATFKIKKLTKKGKYKATITFKGNNAYKATTKKVKITIK